jgi:nicotinamide mononucleotide transporter
MFDYIQKNWLEWFGVVTGLLYLFLEIRQHAALWVVGFMSSMVYVFVFFQSKFYADMGLNIYYVLMSMYGFWLWQFGRKEEPSSEAAVEEIAYRNLTWPLAAKLSVVAVLLYFSMAHVLIRFTDSPVPYGDALSTALSIVATWMLAKKIIQHWFVWMFVNAFSVFLFAWRELYPTALLFFFYGALSLVGYYKWKIVRQKQFIDNR